MLDIKEIMKVLPHRYPFLLVDRVEEIVVGKKAVAIKNVTINENFFNGHFPIEPVMPGVLIIEAMAQVAGIVVFSLEGYENKIGYLVGVNKAKFRKKVVPGDVLKLEVEMLKLKKNAGVFKGISYVNNEKVSEAELTFIIG